MKYLAEGLLQQHQEVFVITAYHKNQEEAINGVKVYRVKHPNVYWSYESPRQPKYKKLLWHLIESYNPVVKRRVKGLLMRERPDVLHIRNTEDFSPYLAKVAHQLGIPVLVTLNSYTWLCPRATMFRRGRNCEKQCVDCKLMTWPKKTLSWHVNTVVGVSQRMIDTHRRYQYFSQAKQEVVYTSPPTYERLPLPPADGTVFGYMGRIHPTKGVHQLIAAFVTLPGEPTLLIAGEGPDDYVDQCKRSAAGHPRIVFLGRYEVQQFYEKIAIAIISSLWHEPFPRALVEAYALGRPVIAANTGGTPEMVEPGRTGWIYDPLTPTELREVMQQAVQQTTAERASMRRNINALIQDKFPNDIQRYQAIYQEISTNEKP